MSLGYEVDFLAVGEGGKSGDAIALRFGNLYGSRDEQRVIVIDGGYQESGKQLVEHIQSYYKTDQVDLVISTHPDGDHASGLSVVLEELQVGTLWMHQPWNHTNDIAQLFQDGRVTDASVSRSLKDALEATAKLEQIAKAKHIPIIEPFRGLADDSKHLFVLGPSTSFYENQLPYFRCTPAPRADFGLLEKIVAGTLEFAETVAEAWNYETLNDDGETSAENDSSTILLLLINDRSLLFTADAGIPALTEAVDLLEYVEFDFSTLSFIQIPHHGSRRNIGPSLLDRLIVSDTMTAFVSAAMQGAPKHPSKKVTNAFRRRGCEVHATQGVNKLHTHNAPARWGWTASAALPFYTQVEE